MKCHKVAVVQHYLAHYRWPILNRLCLLNTDIKYVVAAGIETNVQIKTIGWDVASRTPESGGLRWMKLKNLWFGKEFLWQRGLLKLSVNAEFDTIIYTGCVFHLSSWLSAILARLTGKRILMWTHGVKTTECSWRFWVKKCFFRLSHGLLLFGNRARDFLAENGFSADNLYVVFNSLDLETQKRTRHLIQEGLLSVDENSFFSNPERPLLIFVGRLIASKRLSLLIEALQRLLNEGIDANLLMVGDGPEYEGLKSLAQRIGVGDSVHFFGACYEEAELGPLLSMADLFVSPGEVGLNCIHAMSYGTPVITHDNMNAQGPEVEAIIPGETGAFFPDGDVSGLVATLRTWLADAASKEEVSANCMAVVESKYNPAYQVEVFNAAVLGQPASTIGKGSQCRS